MASPNLVQYESETESSSSRVDETIPDAGYEAESGDRQEEGSNGTWNLILTPRCKDAAVLPIHCPSNCIETDVGLFCSLPTRDRY